MDEEFRVIPGYANYSVSKDGRVKSIPRDLILRQYLFNGYYIVDTFRGSLTETLPVHRAVALAWVDNPDPETKEFVNHKDGCPTNNWYENLEWVTCSENNYHAINTGLRRDNIECRVRDFFTKEVFEFSSIAQAAEFMGLRKDAPISMIKPKMFGKLISGKYEFKFAEDETPWFYENREGPIKPSRYMIIVTDPQGRKQEIYSTVLFLRSFKLGGSPSQSIPALVEYANSAYPDWSFSYRDSYAEQQVRPRRNTKDSAAVQVTAVKDENTLVFGSLTKCARYFGVDRSSIVNRLKTLKDLDGWTFTTSPSC